MSNEEHGDRPEADDVEQDDPDDVKDDEATPGEFIDRPGNLPGDQQDEPTSG